MNFFSAILVMLIPCWGYAQHHLPVIQATSGKAKIYEQDNPVSNWNLNPKLKPDTFTTNKLTSSKTVVFKTDIDSIQFTLKPGGRKNFIVLLNGKDSCFTTIQSPAIKNYNSLKPERHDTVPFFVNSYNTNFIKVVFNTVDSLILNFDTGATEVSITTDALRHKVTSNPELYTTNYSLKIGSRFYQSRIHDATLVGNETDGLLGWNVFDGMIVELNYDRNEMVLHSKMPKQMVKDKEYAKYKIRYIQNRPFIESEVVQGGSKSKSWYLFDLGYQRTAMLDNDLLRAAGFPTDSMEVIKKVIMHDVKGNEVPVLTMNLQTLKIGNFELQNVPIQLLGESKPMNGINIHILGDEVLKRFNTILDFQNDVIYLKPNHLYNTGYTDQKKTGA